MSGFSRDSYHVLFNLDEFQFSLRGLKILLGAFLALHLVAAFLAPATYQAIVWWHAGYPNTLNNYLVGKPFPAFFDRTRLLLLLLSIPWIFMQCRLLSAQKIGYAGALPWYSSFWRFYMGGVICAVCALGILIAVGSLEVASSLTFPALFSGLAGAFVSAFIIAAVDELVFRSLIFRMFYTAFTPVFSVILSSLFFAYLHFKNPAGVWDYSTSPAEVGWWDGLSVGLGIIAGIFLHFDWVHFLNLALVGYVLTVVFMRTRSLWAVMGLHAGWVTPLFLIRGITVPDVENSSSWWGTFRLVDGFFTTICLLVLAIYFSRIYKPRQPSGYS